MFRTSNIWHLAEDDSITVRRGQISIDPDDMPLDASDATRALSISAGLQPRDFVVFADKIGTTRCTVEPVGFVVTDVQPDGSGIIVHGEKITQSPKDWASKRAMDIWRYLEEIEPAIYAEFGLEALRAHINNPYRSK